MTRAIIIIVKIFSASTYWSRCTVGFCLVDVVMCLQVMLYGLAAALGIAANTACLPITLKIITIITMELIMVSTGVMYCQAECVKKVTIPSVTGEFCRGVCSSVVAVLASSSIIFVKGPRSIVTSFGR